MNRYKSKILSVLLFAFTFFIVHDYVIETSACANTYELYSSSELIEEVSDTTLELHDNIHSMLQVHINHNLLLLNTFLKIRPTTKEKSSISYISFVPHRPPLT